MRSMGPINERGLDFRASLESPADFERFDDGASKFRRHVVSKPQDAGYVEFNLPPGGKKFFQALAIVHNNACGRQPACRRLWEIHAVLMQQIARCRLQKSFAARIKSAFHQQIYLPEFIRAHAQCEFFALRASESSGPKRPYQPRHCQKALLAFFPFALLLMVCHWVLPPRYVNVNLHLHNCQVEFWPLV